MLEDETQSGGRRRYNKYDWPTCDLLDVRLAAAGAEGLVPNVSRPEGLQVWNADPMAGDTTLDWGDRCEVLRPVSIVSPRNGLFTGKVGVGCDKAIEGLRAVAGDLKGDLGAVIPASAIRFRYGLPWGSESGLGRRESGSLLGVLAEAPPPQVPAGSIASGAAAGATTAVWVTIKVPPGAKAGRYAGEFHIEAGGQKPISVPVELTVADWTLPEPQDYRTWLEVIEQPDTLAVEYKAPRWSDQHWELIAKSLALIVEDPDAPGGTFVHWATWGIPASAREQIGRAHV
jgi:hypothetical protein